MPYAPGIQDISGQLLAQGMSQAGAARARSIESIGESLTNGIKQYQQNQNFTQQSLAKFYSNMQDPDYKDLVTKIISDDSNQMGVPSNLKKAIQNAGTGKIDAGQAAMLATWSQDFSEKKRVNQEQEQKKAQTILALAQGANQRAAADETNFKLQGMRSAQAQLDKIDTGNLSAAPSRPMVPQGISQFGNVESLASQQTPFDPRSNPIIAGALNAQVSPARIVNPASVAANYSGTPNTVSSMPAGPKVPAELSNAEINRQATIAQLTEFRNTGKSEPFAFYKNQILEGISKTARNVRADEASIRAQEIANRAAQAMTLDQADAKLNELKKQYPDRAFILKPHGTIASAYNVEEAVKPDPNTELRKIQFETRIKPVQIYLDNISKNADLARNDLPRLDRLDAALESGVTTGPGAEISTYAKSLFSDTGLVNNKDLAKNQVFQADLAMDRLLLTRVLLDGQGSVQVEERKRVDSAAANVANDPRAIKELMKMHRAATNRSIAAEDHRIMLDEKSDFNNPESLIKIDRDMKKWFQQNPLSKFGFPQGSPLSGESKKPEPMMFADELERNAKQKNK